MKFNSKIAAAVAALATVLTLSLAGSASATTPPSDGGVRADGSVIVCVKNTSPDLHMLSAPNNGLATCPSPWTTVILDQKGQKGDTGATGATGATGPQGPAGTNGKNGKNAQALPYGVALLNISRGGAAATTWGSFTTTLGSPAPMGDQASGNLRVSCSAAQAPCVVTLKAYATVAGVNTYPRINIDSTDFNAGGPETSCEYVDGTNNNGGSAAIGNGAANATTVPLGVGGTLDCNEAQTLPADGVVTELDLPTGRYNITVTEYFTITP